MGVKKPVRKRMPSLLAEAFATTEVMWSFQENQTPGGHRILIFCHNISMSSNQRKCQETFHLRALEIRKHCFAYPLKFTKL